MRQFLKLLLPYIITPYFCLKCLGLPAQLTLASLSSEASPRKCPKLSLRE